MDERAKTGDVLYPREKPGADRASFRRSVSQIGAAFVLVTRSYADRQIEGPGSQRLAHAVNPHTLDQLTVQRVTTGTQKVAVTTTVVVQLTRRWFNSSQCLQMKDPTGRGRGRWK
jgi:hypothetical protein